MCIAQRGRTRPRLRGRDPQGARAAADGPRPSRGATGERESNSSATHAGGCRNQKLKPTRMRQKRNQLQARATKAEVSLEAAKAELEKITKALERASESERQARETAAELRAQLEAAGDEKSKGKK